MKKLKRQDADRASPELPFINAAEGRLHQRKQAQIKQKQTIESLQLSGKRALLEGNFDHAYATGTQLLKTAAEMHGMNSEELIPAYLILGGACMGLSRLPQAEKYLSQAQWLMLKTLSCDNSVKCLVFRQLGLLYTAQGQYEKARLTLADDIYHASMKYGCSDIRVSSGYFHLGNVFFHKDQSEVANSLHDQVLTLWKDFFIRAAESHTVTSKPTDSQSLMSSQISIAEATKPSLDSDFSLDVAEQIEAVQMLQTIRLSREKQASSGAEPSKLMDAYYTLALLYRYLGNQSLMVEYAEKAVQLNNSQATPDMDFSETLTSLLTPAS